MLWLFSDCFLGKLSKWRPDLQLNLSGYSLKKAHPREIAASSRLDPAPKQACCLAMKQMFLNTSGALRRTGYK